MPLRIDAPMNQRVQGDIRNENRRLLGTSRSLLNSFQVPILGCCLSAQGLKSSDKHSRVNFVCTVDISEPPYPLVSAGIFYFLSNALSNASFK